MQDKLRQLSDEAFLTLRDQVDEEFKRRRYSLFKPGRMAWFDKGGERIYIKITGFAIKNVTGEQCDQYGLPVTPRPGRNGKWRCSPECLTPILPAKKPTATVYANAGSY